MLLKAKYIVYIYIYIYILQMSVIMDSDRNKIFKDVSNIFKSLQFFPCVPFLE